MNFPVRVIQVFLVTATFLSYVSLQTFTKHPEDVIVNVDDAAWLNCSFSEVLTTHTQIAWQKDSEWFAFSKSLVSNIQGGDVRIIIDIDREHGEYNIRFMRVALDDHGLYKCGVYNTTTDSYIWSNEAKLTVQNFIKQPSNVTAVEGETILLSCHVNVMPAGSTLIWEKDYTYYAINDFLIDNNIASRVHVEGNHTAGEYNLLFGNLTLHDSGVYRCGVFTNVFYHWSEDAILTVSKNEIATSTPITITTKSTPTSTLVAVTSKAETSIVSSVDTPTSPLETRVVSSVDTPTLLMTSEAETTSVSTTSAMTTMDYGEPTTTEGKLTTTNIVTSRETSTVSPSTQSDVTTSSTANNTEPLTETKTHEGDTTIHRIGVTDKPAASSYSGVELWIILVALAIALVVLIAVVVILLIVFSRVRKQGPLKKTEANPPHEESLEKVSMKLKATGFVNPIHRTQENTTRLNDSNDFQSTAQIEGQQNEIETVGEVSAQPVINFNSQRENVTETENNIQNEDPLTKELPQVPENSPDLLADTKGKADKDSTQNDTQSCEDNTLIAQNAVDEPEDDSQLTRL